VQQFTKQADKMVLPDAFVGRQVFLDVFSEHELPM
jgi:hypothetical protein